MWDSSYASGGDLFLESHDAHVLASAAAGVAAWVLPLSGVAWLGRLVSWLLFIFAWLRLTRSLGLVALLQPVGLVAFFLATKYGHWAGEWAIGGFEAKSIAYPFILLALAEMLAGRWRRVWLWSGLAVAWHPVVGGWAGLTIGIVWLTQANLKSRVWQQLPWLAAGAAISSLGVVPAALGIGGQLDASERISPAQVHVYYRLAHHLFPQSFPLERHLAAFFSLLALAFATALWWRISRRGASAAGGRLLAVAWLAVAISCVGLLVDLTLSRTRPDIAAQLLRFYWFRWSDVAVPLAWTLVLSGALQRFAYRVPSAQLTARGRHDSNLQESPPRSGERFPTMPRLTSTGGFHIGATFLVVSIAFGVHLGHNLDRSFPEADELVMESTGPIVIRSNRYLDWLAVCRWIKENTPEDSLWLTPKYQQTFKWYAGRAEVVCWKDVPQDNAAVVEWYRRIQRCAPPRDSNGRIRSWTTAELLDLGRQYHSRWILLDRTYQLAPPNLEIVYPIDIENRSFAVFRIPESMLDD